jgi:steroid delta-isomerase-like uncharacterized protein
MRAGKTTDSAEARLQLVLEHVQAEVDHDLDAIMRTWGENPRLDDVPWDEHWIGTDKVREHYEELLTTLPDLTIDVHDIYESENAVVIEVTAAGTHLGQWRDLPPLRRRMEWKVCAVHLFDDTGRLAVVKTYYDRATVLEQLGVFRDPRSTSGKVLAVAMPPFTILRGFGHKLRRRGNHEPG